MISLSPLVRHGIEVLPCPVVDGVAPFRDNFGELSRYAATAPVLLLRSPGLGRIRVDVNDFTIFDRRTTLLLLEFLHDLDGVSPESAYYTLYFLQRTSTVF